MFKWFGSLGNITSSVLLILTQVVPFMAALKAQNGQPISADEKSAIVSIVLGALKDFGGAAGAAIANDTAVQAIISDAVDLIVNLHTTIEGHVTAATPAK